MNQSSIELLIHPKHINQDIKDWLNKHYADDISILAVKLDDYLSQDYWDSKNNRLSVIKQLNLTDVIVKLLVQSIFLAQNEIPLVSLCSSVSYKDLSKIDSIQTNADILYIIDTYAPNFLLWDIHNDGTRVIKTNISLPEDLQRRIAISCVLPPMITKPKKLNHNSSSALLTIAKDSLILGDRENYHDDSISLDVINKLNQVPLKLSEIAWLFERQIDIDEDLDDETKEQAIKTHKQMQEQFEFFRDKLSDKTMYLTHKVDKRGRIYAQGYHFTTQGTSFEKACLELKTKEFITGEL